MAAIAVAGALALTGCSAASGGASDGSDASSTFNVLMIAGLTGGVSGIAQAQVDGMTAGIDSINESGGILGHQVELTVIDDQLDPTKSVTLLQNYLDSTTPQLVVPGQSSTQALAMMPILTRAKILSLGMPQAAALNDPVKYPYNFIVNSDPADDATAFVAELQREGVEKVGMICANDAFGQALAEAYAAAYEEAGIDFAIEQFSPTDLDMTGQLQRLQASNPEKLVMAVYGAAAGYVLKSRTQIGWDIPTLGTTTLGNANNLSQISTPADWTNLTTQIFTMNTVNRIDSAATKELESRLEEDGSKFDQVWEHYSLQWDAIHLVKAAAEQANSTDGPAIAAALQNLDPIAGDSPLISFSEERFAPTDHFLVLDGVEDTYSYVRPGPIEKGVWQSVE